MEGFLKSFFGACVFYANTENEFFQFIGSVALVRWPWFGGLGSVALVRWPWFCGLGSVALVLWLWFGGLGSGLYTCHRQEMRCGVQCPALPTLGEQ